ncbi:UDP-galactopyranose mutase [Achromobacter aloeverae]|uniref:UDP-galactopyranose mutase n=2 Tax=Achromobacter aloeverae TaxID=1750518 RepID=A0A4Q1HKQ6_9BURK|nr:UDP-galactopyranose mutase [Achromobacter aloeverae]
MVRWATERKVVFIEEPIIDGAEIPWLEDRHAHDRVLVLRAHVGADNAADAQRRLLENFCQEYGIREPILWYYTPMSRAFSRDIPASLIVYDCMDELSAFCGAPAQLVDMESELFDAADVVFAGGYSLYREKRKRHPNVHLFPSSVDIAHFRQARGMGEHVARPLPDQEAKIAEPRLGFFGVLDERFDGSLVQSVARMRRDWQFVLVGPVVKIDPASLPVAPNIHYLGPCAYDALPAHLAAWQVALMPFGINASTRFISPTKTPEYLAGGRPVVSTPIADVVRTYGGSGVVHIAADAHAFVSAIEDALVQMKEPGSVWKQADHALAGMSWDATWRGMREVMAGALSTRRPAAVLPGRGASTGRVVGKPWGQKRYDYLIVGAGFAGSVLAERLAADGKQHVLLIDKRHHIGGNAYDCHNADGLLIHRYGPHILHTNSDNVVSYLSRFTDWRPYEHRVLASVDGMLVPMPINLTTLARLYGRPFSPDEAEQFFAMHAEPVDPVLTSEDIVVSKIGRQLYEKFFRGYTRKQWGLDPSQLDSAVAARVPARTSLDDRYFTDAFQKMPAEGYTRMFERMLDHPNITLALGVDFRDARRGASFESLIYTGPIDEYFGYRHGRLPYRSLRFEHRTLRQPWLQTVGVVNYPAEAVPYTRVTEYKHLTGQRHPHTAITYEYPSDIGDPYYPIPRPENAALYRRYQALADEETGVRFVGRLATYRYYNMDQVVAQALATYASIARGDTPAAPATRNAAVAPSEDSPRRAVHADALR